MKRSLFAILSIVIMVSLLLGGCQTKPAPTDDSAYPATSDTTTEGYPAGNKVIVATDATFPPFETVDEATKELTGFDIDLMNAVGEKAGLTIEYVNQPFDPVLAGVASCQYDIAIAAITITEDRQKEMLFSDPYIDAGQIIVVAVNNNTITGMADLEGKTLAAQLGTTGEIEAKNVPGVTYKPYDSYDMAFLDLANGQVDAVIADYPTARGFITKRPDQIKSVGEPFTNEFYGIAVCKNRTDLIPILNEALAALKADGTMLKLEQKWMTELTEATE